jgi:ketosteroid isomerase-like protein
MSRANAEAVGRVYDRWREGDFRTSDVFDPDVVFVLRPEFPDAGAYHGVAEVAAYTRGFLEPWTHIAIEAEEITDAGDTVIAAVRQHGVGDESGAATEFRYFQVWSFRGPRVIRLENVRTRAEALEAAGMPG